MKVRKAVITAAGKGTRMRNITLVLPKALLPLYSKEGNEKIMSPVSSMVIKALKAAGIEEICFIVRKNAKLIKTYYKNEKFTYLKQRGANGFGDAVLAGEPFANNEPVLIHTEDIMLTSGYDVALRFFESKSADAIFFARKVDNPSNSGIVTVSEKENFMDHEVYRVTNAEEKPKNPKSDIGIVGLYVFSPKIFEQLRNNSKKNNELTSGIQGIIASGGKVYAIMMKDEKRLNVGDPDSYFNALKYTYERASS